MTMTHAEVVWGTEDLELTLESLREAGDEIHDVKFLHSKFDDRDLCFLITYTKFYGVILDGC